METWVGTITAFNGLSYVVKYEGEGILSYSMKISVLMCVFRR